jgi:hypothetical protein
MPTRLAAVGLVIGLALWLGGVLSVFGETSVVSSFFLLFGVLVTVAAAFILLLARADRAAPYSQLTGDGALVFCLAFGVGLAALGLALSGAFPVLARLIFGVGGLALIAWSPRALSRFRREL